MAVPNATGSRLRREGFTLVELLIVVIILAILAAIVVPQFASSTDDAKLAALDTSLANMRAAVDIYNAQHGEYPAANTDGANPPNSDLSFISQMTLFTDSDGDAQATKDAAHIYGPYLKSSTLPPEPIMGLNTLIVVSAGSLPLTADPIDPGGWKFDSVTGQFIMNHSAYEGR